VPVRVSELDWVVTCEAWSWYMPMALSAGSVFGLSEYGLLSRVDDPGIVGVQRWEIKLFSCVSSRFLARSFCANILVAARSITACSSQCPHFVSFSVVSCSFGRSLGFSSESHRL
jgi:hypothetical protein